MAFFDQLGKKLSDMGQNVSQQTKNFTDITRLNGLISEKNRQIPQIYAEIGRAYFERHRDDPDAEEIEQIEKIKTLLAEIAQHEEEIKQIRGVTKCPQCGADVSLGAAFCSSCGMKVVREEPAPVTNEALNVCPDCGAPLKEGNLFCNHCGRKLDDPIEADETSEVEL